MAALDIVLIVLICISLLFSLLATILVFAWRHTTPEIADLRSAIIGMGLDQATIVDKFTAYMQREDARHARKGKKKRDDSEEVYEIIPPAAANPAAETKDQFRTRVFAERTSRRTANVAVD